MANSTSHNGRPRSSSQERPMPRKFRDSHSSSQYQVLLDTLRATELDSGLALWTVGLTSAKRREGVTSVACNLALHAACHEMRILLVDANMADPSLQRIFQLPPSPGLADFLSGEALGPDCIHDLSSRPYKSLPTALKNSFRRGKGISRSARNRESFTAPRLSIMTAGTSNIGTRDFFQSEKDLGAGFLEDIRTNFDLVILDLPEVSAVRTCGFSLYKLDGVIFVLEAEATSDQAARKNLQQLRRHGANVLGVAFNKCRSRLPRWIDRKLGD